VSKVIQYAKVRDLTNQKIVDGHKIIGESIAFVIWKENVLSVKDGKISEGQFIPLDKK
jgi:hypothetical protein